MERDGAASNVRFPKNDTDRETQKALVRAQVAETHWQADRGPLMVPLWAMDLAEVGVGRMLDAQRLKRVDVEVSVSSGGIVERVSPTLSPIGTDESQSA